MERSGTLAEPSDNSTTPYIKKRPTLLGQPLFIPGRFTCCLAFSLRMDIGADLATYDHTKLAKSIMTLITSSWNHLLDSYAKIRQNMSAT